MIYVNYFHQKLKSGARELSGLSRKYDREKKNQI